MSKIKKLLILIIVTISITYFSSCKKDEEICYNCELIDNTRGEPTGDNSGGGYNSNLDENVRICDTEDEVKKKRTTYVNLGYTCTKE